MIRHHWYSLSGDARGRGCHVYATGGVPELLEWLDERRWPTHAVQGGLVWRGLEVRLAHVDVFGRALSALPPVRQGVDDATFLADARRAGAAVPRSAELCVVSR